MNGGLSLTLLTVTSKTSESNNTVWKTKIFFATHILFETHFEKFLDNNGLFNTIMNLDFVQFQLGYLDFTLCTIINVLIALFIKRGRNADNCSETPCR